MLLILGALIPAVLILLELNIELRFDCCPILKDDGIFTDYQFNKLFEEYKLLLYE